MSFDAIKWAMAQPVGRASAKFVLVAMADAVNAETSGQEMVCWPSARHLAHVTAQDAKTIQSSLRRLRDDGYIEPTGQRVGATGQVIVYRLKTPESGSVEAQPRATEDTRFSGETHPKTDEAKTPVFPEKTTVFPGEDTRFSGETHPKTGDGTTKEPGKEPGKKQSRAKSGFDPMSVELPAWLDAEAWTMWVKYRAATKKPITEDAARLQLGKLAKFREAGHDPRLVIEAAIENSWQGLYLPKDGSTSLKAQGTAQVLPLRAAPKPGTDQYLKDHRDAQWWRDAGFANVYEAHNGGCWDWNAHLFRDGRKLPRDEEAHA